MLYQTETERRLLRRLFANRLCDLQRSDTNHLNGIILVEKPKNLENTVTCQAYRPICILPNRSSILNAAPAFGIATKSVDKTDRLI